MDSERKCMETSLESLYLDIGPYKVKGFRTCALIYDVTTLMYGDQFGEFLSGYWTLQGQRF